MNTINELIIKIGCSRSDIEAVLNNNGININNVNLSISSDMWGDFNLFADRKLICKFNARGRLI
jgi:CDP-diacylglycerol pyrophosphatase